MSVVRIAPEVEARIKEIEANVRRQLPSRAFRAANELRNASLEVLAGSRSGRTYRSPLGGSYTASAPGEPPAVRTGALRSLWRPTASGVGGINPAIETDVPYAWLDEGSPGGMIKPRPYVKKVVEMAMPEIDAIYSEPY